LRAETNVWIAEPGSDRLPYVHSATDARTDDASATEAFQTCVDNLQTELRRLGRWEESSSKAPILNHVLRPEVSSVNSTLQEGHDPGGNDPYLYGEPLRLQFLSRVRAICFARMHDSVGNSIELLQPL